MAVFAIFLLIGQNSDFVLRNTVLKGGPVKFLQSTCAQMHVEISVLGLELYNIIAL